MKGYHFIPVISLIVLCVAAKPQEDESSKGKAQGGKEYKSGLIASYYMDPTNWNGKWPDNVSVPQANPDDYTFTEYKYSRMEPLINHQFINKGWFSVRWTGYFDPAGRGEDWHGDGADKKSEGKGTPRTQPGQNDYTFFVHADDGCRLYIDGERLIDDWRACDEESPLAKRKSKSIVLKDGMHKIVIEYFQGQSLKHDDRDPIKLHWSSESAGIKEKIIPASCFFHDPDDMKKPAEAGKK